MNAVQAIPEGNAAGNAITIRTKRHAKGLAIEIIDTGGGMTAETQRNLFTPFFTTKPVGVGTGLGLTFVASRVYRVGMLMYGKRATIPEMMRWVRQR